MHVLKISQKSMHYTHLKLLKYVFIKRKYRIEFKKKIKLTLIKLYTFTLN